MITDVFDVQEEIAQSVVHALEVRLGASRGPLVRPPTSDLAAYDLFLRGRFVRSQFTPDGLRRGIAYFEQAVVRDPSFARAYAALADAHVLLVVFADRPALEQLPLARGYARKAVELDDALGDSHWAAGHVAGSVELDLPKAIREYRRAIALDPGNVDARHMHGILLLCIGRCEEAIEELTRAIAIDPLLAAVRMTLGDVYVTMGHPERGAASLREAVELLPDFAYAREQLADAYLQCTRYDDAVAESERAAASGGVRSSAALAYVYAATGRRTDASKILDGLVRADPSPAPTHVAMAYAALGDAEAAFFWLERAVAAHDPHVMGLTRLPGFTPLRADLRFSELARRIGLTS
jgi:serine/threonine-protein kinase